MSGPVSLKHNSRGTENRMQTQMPNIPNEDDNDTAHWLGEGIICMLVGIGIGFLVLRVDTSGWRWWLWVFLWPVVLLQFLTVLLIICGFLLICAFIIVETSNKKPGAYINKPNGNKGRNIPATGHWEEGRKTAVAGRKEKPVDINRLLKELNALIGLQRVKYEVTTLINTVEINKKRVEKGLNPPPITAFGFFR
jgi:hypothetical protein